jgi:hypothetical protein
MFSSFMLVIKAFDKCFIHLSYSLKKIKYSYRSYGSLQRFYCKRRKVINLALTGWGCYSRNFCKRICVGTTLLYSHNSNFDSAYFASSSFCLMLLVPSGGSCRFSLICTIFAFTTALCGPLRGLGYSVDPFPTLYNYLYIVLVCFWSIVREPTPFFRF